MSDFTCQSDQTGRCYVEWINPKKKLDLLVVKTHLVEGVKL